MSICPRARPDRWPKPTTSRLEISVDAKGQIYLQETAIDLDQLVPRLNAISQANHDAKIYIRGDRANSWGAMMEILGAVGGAGYTKVGLVSTPSDKQAQRKK